MRPRRTPPAHIVIALEMAERDGIRPTTRRLGIAHSQIYRWRADIAANGWPTFDDMRDHHARSVQLADERARKAAWARNYRKVTYLMGGPMMVDSTGTARRLQALARHGWTSRVLGERLGVTAARVGHLTQPIDALIHRDTRAAVTALYDEIGLELGGNLRTQSNAERRGWVGVLAWDESTIDDPKARPARNPRPEVIYHLDEIAIEQAMAGRRVKLSHDERREAVRRLIALGLSGTQIAERLHITADAAQKAATRVRTGRRAA